MAQDGQRHDRRPWSTTVDGGPLADDLFAPPAGYKLNQTRSNSESVVVLSVSLLRSASDARPCVTVELRPPRAELESAEGIDAWIDTYHAIRSLARQHIARHDHRQRRRRAGREQPAASRRQSRRAEWRSAHVVPFLTCKHSLEFCLGYADQATHHGFSSLVVLGGDKHARPAALRRPRVAAARSRFARGIPQLELGGWANPNARPRSSRSTSCSIAEANADFYLTQIVSHHQARARSRVSRRGAPPRRHDAGGLRRVLLSQRQPADAGGAAAVPAGAGRGADAPSSPPARRPIDVCARTIRTLLDLGARHFYISNLPLRRTGADAERHSRQRRAASLAGSTATLIDAGR